MNNTRRKAIRKSIQDINEIIPRINALADSLKSIVTDVEIIKADIECIQYDEEDARDNIPESLQDSERYWASDEACDNLSDAVTELEDILDNLDISFDEAIEYLNGAKE